MRELDEVDGLSAVLAADLALQLVVARVHLHPEGHVALDRIAVVDRIAAARRRRRLGLLFRRLGLGAGLARLIKGRDKVARYKHR